MANKWTLKKKALDIKQYDFNRFTKGINNCIMEAFEQIQNITKYEDDLEDLVGIDNIPDGFGYLKADTLNFLQEKLGQYNKMFKEMETKIKNNKEENK